MISVMKSLMTMTFITNFYENSLNTNQKESLTLFNWGGTN
jgi:hypothetical protein